MMATNILSLVVLLRCLFLVLGACECGYSVNRTTDPRYEVFTDVLESDFTVIKHIEEDMDWIIQGWSDTGIVNHGPYGRINNASNVIANPTIDITKSTEGIQGGDAGLQLIVRSKLQNINGSQYVSCSELDSFRTDMLYGSFRVGIKQNGVNGTCGAFFWYYNDTQEIDLEFLSAEIEPENSSINLVLHSTQTFAQGNDAKGTPTYRVIQLPYSTDEDVHEYRFDWTPDRVSFYADGKWIWDVDEVQYIPVMPGHIVLSHWSNGNFLWSGGPPVQDATMLVTYAKAYFNSSNSHRAKDYINRCSKAKDSPVCVIPDQLGPPVYGNKSGDRPFFFSENSTSKVNYVVNQTVYKPSAAMSFQNVPLSTLTLSFVSILVYLAAL